MAVPLMLVCRFPFALQAMLLGFFVGPVAMHFSNDPHHANAGLSSLWKALPDAVYDDSSKTLHVSTGWKPLANCDTIYVRDCHTQLTNMALEMTPFYPSSGTIQAHLESCPILHSPHANAAMAFVMKRHVDGYF